MSQSLFSQNWYRVAGIKVRLRKHADIHRHTYRGEVWYVLQDHISGQFQRFTHQAYFLIGLMDGERTLQQIWDIACERFEDDLPTQDEVIQLVGQLNQANVIQTDVLPDIAVLQQRRESEQRRKWLQQLKSPLSIRIPLLDPEGFLSATQWVARIVFSKFGAVIWFIVVALGMVMAATHWTSLTQNLSDQVLAVENLILMALAYPIVKLVHELGHGYAVKRWGGEVHEMGVMLLIFIPVPYVDASAASSFLSKYQRMMVGAVGVLGELFMAAIAMIVWVMVEPGVVRAIAYNVMLIGGVSTVLFNGNPLLRFDAYYVLADYLEIPNLASRGNAQVGYLIKRYVFRLSQARSSAHSVSESAWLASYAVAAYCYRMFVMIAISLFVATKYLFIGAILAIWSIWTSLLLPLLKMMVKPMNDVVMSAKKQRIYTISSLTVLLMAMMLLFFPAPYKTYSQGVLYIPQDSYVRAQTSGFITELSVTPGSQVTEGHAIIQLRDPELEAQAKLFAAQLNEARIRYKASVENRSESEILLHEMKYLALQYQEIQARLKQMRVISPNDGEFILPQGRDNLGQFYHRGDVIAYVLDYAKLPLTVLVAENDIENVRNNTQSVSIKLVSNPHHSYESRILRQVPAPTHQLPSAILATDGGGLIALDPSSLTGLQSYHGYFQVEVDAAKIDKFRFDERAHVLFEHPAEPLAYRWYRSIRRVFLRQFDV